MKKYVISAGHGKYVSGANGYIKEHEEAAKIVKAVHKILKNDYHSSGYAYVETTAKNQNDNLANIVKYHNSKTRDLDISVHFNSSSNSTATGTEVCYYDIQSTASKFSKAISRSLKNKNRGAKERKELYLLRNTTEKALLLEICFVTNKNDVKRYKENFNKLCKAIAQQIASYLQYTKKSGKTYTVTKGDTLYSIAKNHNITLAHLLDVNGFNHKTIIYPNQKIKL